jgi:hypothetical protein
VQTLENFEEYHTKGKETFTYAREISKPYGSLENILVWCKLETRADWAWQLIEPGRYIFYFVNEQDYFAFLIKWG